MFTVWYLFKLLKNFCWNVQLPTFCTSTSSPLNCEKCLNCQAHTIRGSLGKRKRTFSSNVVSCYLLYFYTSVSLVYLCVRLWHSYKRHSSERYCQYATVSVVMLTLQQKYSISAAYVTENHWCVDVNMIYGDWHLSWLCVFMCVLHHTHFNFYVKQCLYL